MSHALLPSLVRDRRGVAVALACAAAAGGGRAAPCQDPFLKGQGGASTAGQQPGQGQAPPGGAAAPLATVRGQLQSRYWLRWITNESDQDLYETLSLDLGDPERHAVTGFLQGRVSIDFDGEAGNQPFASLDDSYDGNPTGHLYYAYADLQRIANWSLVRIGRQVIHDTPELALFDGLRAETESFGGIEAQVGVYGGVSTHLYEASISGDWMTGVYVQARPWRGGRMRLDWMHLEDEALLGLHNNDLWAAGVWQTVGAFALEGQYSGLESESRDVRGRVSFTDAGNDLLLQGSWYHLLNTQNDLVLELDPFFSSTQALFPYQQFSLLASKGLWEQFDVRGGLDIRRVEDAADVGTYNHDYERFFGTVAVRDAFVPGLTLSATGDWWDSAGENIETWGADADYELGDRTHVSAGSYYALYKFDLQLNTEIDHLRTYFARLHHKHSKTLTLDTSFELEENDIDRYYTLRLGATWKF